jgi:hypothetical protein
MADIVAGTGGTFNGTSIEKTLFQSLHFIQNAERTSTEEERFSFTKDDTFRMKGSFTLPGKINYVSTTGLFTITAEPYLSSMVFTPGSPVGTIKSITLSQFFIDTCQYIILWQQNQTKNPNSQYNLSMSFDYSALKFMGEFNLPYTSVLTSAGAVIETATDWLLT